MVMKNEDSHSSIFFVTNGNERNVIKFMVLGRMRLSDEANEAI